MPAQQATILIPDISGYTEFVSKTEIDHSSHILNQLLETIVQSVNEDFVISEVEGDAVLMYRTGNPPMKKEIIDQCVKIFTAFHNELREMSNDSICQCGACKGIINLTLKFVVHFGTISEIKVARFVKASGLDMVIAHRLLKNSIGSHEYLLVTKNYLNNIPDADELHELSWTPSMEDYSSIGTVEFHFALLAPVKKMIPEIPRQHDAVPSDDSSGVSIEMDVNFKDVYAVLINPEMRKYYAGDVRDVTFDAPVPLLRAKHYCVFDNVTVEIEPMNVDISEHEIKLAEYERIPEMNYYSVFTSVVTNLGNNRCRLTYYVYPEEGHTIPPEMKAMIMEMGKAAQKNLKTLMESGDPLPVLV
ncbi:MAG TPA: DUF2652 domain-containing protein [Chitinophagales bacterium]|nr:DUF2652 domain-containing protein [Chitinophagales bacterium]